MAILLRELKAGLKAFVTWALSLIGLVALMILIYPTFRDQADMLTEALKGMGNLAQMFGLDKLSMSDVLGYYGAKAGVTLLLGGSMYAAVLGLGALSKEEGGRTAEFLFGHPVSRSRAVWFKLLSVIVFVALMNIVVDLASVACFQIIGENYDMGLFALISLMFFVVQIEIALLCFAISSAISRGSHGFAIGLPLVLYFLSLVSEVSEEFAFLDWITPFSYARTADIITNRALNPEYMLIAGAVSLVSACLAFAIYGRRDLRA